MRVAVAGAAGMIGSALVKALVAEDRVSELRAIDRKRNTYRDSKVRSAQRDIGDPEIASQLAGTDVLVHLAFGDHDPHATVEASLRASRNLFEAALAAGTRTILYASSSAIYGAAPENPVPLDERHPLRPAPFPYPQTKLAVEQLLDELAERHPHVRIVRLRPSWVVGPGARMLFAGRAYVSLSDFDPAVQVTWIDDVVSGFTAALHAPAASGAFNLGAPGTVRASEIAGILGARAIRLPYRARRAIAAALTRLGVRGTLHPGFVDMDRFPIVLDSARARSELGWAPRHTTRQALELVARSS